MLSVVSHISLNSFTTTITNFLSTVCEQSKYHHVRLSSLSSFIHRPNNRLLLVTLPSSSPPHLFTSAHLIRYDHLHTSIPKLMPFALTKLPLLIGRHVLALFFPFFSFLFFLALAS